MNLWERSWFAPVLLVVVVIGGLVSLTLLGSQVSGVLSTVGSSVGGPGTVSDADTTGGDTTGGDTGNGGSISGDTTSGSGAGEVVLAVARDDQLIIKTGTLVLEVGGLDAAVSSSAQRIGALGGYISGSDRSGSGDGAQATLTYRIPAARWDEAMAAVRGLATEIQLEKSTTEDVTSQVVDVGARIRNLQATEQALQKIMDRATVIKDVLTVQVELTTVRGHIEELTAQKAHLESEAAYSTLTVTFTLKPAPVLAEQQAAYDPAAEVDAASASLVGVLQDVATAGIWFGIVWLPILASLAVVLAVGFLMTRRVRRMA
jgi:hypothetical protein